MSCGCGTCNCSNKGLDTFSDYERVANSTAIYNREKYNIIYPSLGLAGESGEVAEKIKKVLRDNEGTFSDEKKQEIAKELGDCLWYINALASDIGYSLSEIANMNIKKLLSRKERDQLNGDGDNR